MSVKGWIGKKFLEGKLPLWMYRLAGKIAASKIKLKEINMADPVESKKWFLSKTIWAAIIGVILGAVTPISTAFGHPIVVPSWVFEILAGLGLYSLRTADTKIS